MPHVLVVIVLIFSHFFAPRDSPFGFETLWGLLCSHPLGLNFVGSSQPQNGSKKRTNSQTILGPLLVVGFKIFKNWDTHTYIYIIWA